MIQATPHRPPIQSLLILGLPTLLLLAGCGVRSEAGPRAAALVDCPASFTPIHQVQGSRARGPMDSRQTVVRGIVSATFPGPERLDGFFLQELEPDRDPRTSDGLFVYAPGRGQVTPGDVVQVRGRLAEIEKQTALRDIEELLLCERRAAPRPTQVTLPLRGHIESYEGMLLEVTESLTISGVHNLGRRGQIIASAGGRLFKGRGTHVDKLKRRLVIDDGSREEDPRPVPHLDGDRVPRVGDRLEPVTGILAQEESGYVMLPTQPLRTKPIRRPTAPAATGGSHRIASFNVLNYFTTFRERGADDRRELERQQTKIVGALVTLDADAVGLMELENNGQHALENLLAVLNAKVEEPYAAVAMPSRGLGRDAIRVGMLYRPSRLTPVGEPRSDTDPVFDRPPLAQAFETGGRTFTLVVAHLKSKSCRDAQGSDRDQRDGQGCYNTKRVRQAQRMLRFIDDLERRHGDDVMLIGDLNAYGGEDPIKALERGGLVDQVAKHVPKDQRYTYVYRGEAGYLDHALTTRSLASRVRGLSLWHINADEAAVLDYNTERNPRAFYRPDPFRSSDHDPVLIGLDL